ncbi:MAG: hypothetical protein B7Z30_09275 [Rhizobiales bacterium 12-68-15]|nr:MAG: hypothetical protein B7Z30_09275 [Rhizobiales bacterium 12-68-15]
MAQQPDDELEGIVARFPELVAARAPVPRKGIRTRKARGQMLGGHRSPARGRGMEFDEVRIYQQGDDVRTIDWRVTARTGRTHTKLFQEERERPVLLMLDTRAFMRFGTRGSFKSVLAARAAAMLAFQSADRGDRVGGVLLTSSGIAAHRPQRSRANLLALVKAMADATADGLSAPAFAPEPGLRDGLSRLRHASRPGTRLFLLSDFHDLDDAALLELGRLSLHAQVSLIFLFDRLEAEAPGRGLYRVSDGTGVALLDADSRKAREAYARRLADRRAILEELCRTRGMDMLPLETGSDPADLLASLDLGRGAA